MEKIKKTKIVLIIGIIGIIINIIILSYLEAFCIRYFISQFTFYKDTNDFDPFSYLVESIILGINLCISGVLLSNTIKKLKLLSIKDKKEI